MHALIVGPRGVGKSTLINRIIAELDKPVFGFQTKKEDSLALEEEGSPVYIYDAGKEWIRTPDNLVGYCKNKNFTSMKEAFDRYAPKLRCPVPADHLILMDELGFMEAQSEAFCSAVISLLDGEIPVIAAVKDKDFPFLNTVRSHKNCRCFTITEDNRDSLYKEVLTFFEKEVSLWQEKH